MDLHRKILDTTDPLQRLIVLLAASDGGAPIMGQAKLQKMMFLLSRMSDDMAGRCRYGAGSCGPYSGIVAKAARRLGEIGALHFDDRGEGISITPAGRRAAEEIAGGEDGNTLDIIDSCKDMLNDLPADEALAYVYSSYPSMAGRSAAYGRIRRNMERHIMSMLEKEKISSERAAELLGMPLDHILRRRAGCGSLRRGDRA